MGKIIENCAGIVIGKRFPLCCVLTGGASEEPRRETLRFEVTVAALQRLREWLTNKKVTHVVMESTGSYWIPAFNILEDHFVIVLANPEEVKNRKGHKTDRKDAEHLADLLRHDHVRSSYIPPNQSGTCVILLGDACSSPKTRRASATGCRNFSST
jgi:transposase